MIFLFVFLTNSGTAPRRTWEMPGVNILIKRVAKIICFAYFCKEIIIKRRLAEEYMALNPNKELKLFYSISEVAEMFDVTETLLRYWEKEFPSIAPRKSGRNIRQYTKEDIEEIRLVHNLVKVRGMKLAAAREALKANKEGTLQITEVLERLQQIRAELVGIKKELDGLV